MDHNSLFYYKHFWDQAIPVIAQIGIMDSTAEERYEKVRDILKLKIDEVI